MITITLSLVFPRINSAQEKIEREYGIKKRDVPEPAIEWMQDAFEGFKRIKWYYEESSDGNSYEAKLKWKGYHYSVEFDTTGIIEDIEMNIPVEELSEEARRNITEWMNSSYLKHRIIKIQKQFKGDSDDLEDLMDENETERIEVFYEIEYHGKTKTENELWEGLFDSQGVHVQTRKIVRNPSNNLEF
ncbi:MAG: hypothetical protein ACP5E3_16445 [Bacteroidales bacterium]